jgi:hypothetical protein
MHDHTGPSVAAILFTFANVVITLGYVAVPFLVLRYLPLTRMVLAFGVLFFGLCATTHAGMALFIHGDPGWFWTVEHVVQAIGTWGFILTFHSMLRAATSRRRPAPVMEPEQENRPDDGGRFA